MDSSQALTNRLSCRGTRRYGKRQTLGKRLVFLNGRIGEDKLRHPACSVVIQVRKNVLICVGRDRGGAVSEPISHHPRRHTCRQGQSRMKVPQIMEPNLWQTRGAHRLRESPRDLFRTQWRPIKASEDEADAGVLDGTLTCVDVIRRSLADIRCPVHRLLTETSAGP